MIRAVLYLFVAIILISLIRSVLGVIGKAISGFTAAEPSGREAAEGPRKAGELKKDPVCGTYVSAANSVKRTVGGDVVHFCSAACSEKYRPAKG